MVNGRESATFKSNKGVENLEGTFERRLFLTSRIIVSISKVNERVSSWEMVAVALL